VSQDSFGNGVGKNCTACEAEYQMKKDQELKNHRNQLRFNEKMVGPIFDGLFRNIKMKVVSFNQNDNHQDNWSDNGNRHQKDMQYLNDFICK